MYLVPAALFTAFVVISTLIIARIRKIKHYDDAGELCDGGAPGHGGQGSSLLHRGADKPKVS